MTNNMTLALPPRSALVLTTEIAGIGGHAKSFPEDFVVDELPLYPASGDGAHTFLRIEKRGISTYEAIRRLARALGVAEREVGHAGMKDAQAVTTQWLSVEGVEPAQAADVALPKVRVLDAARHGHKLRKGHLAGNRFRCVLRGIDATPAAEARARAILDRLAREGVPNAFGPQRFGQPPLNHVAGQAIVRGEPQRLLDGLLGPLPADVGTHVPNTAPAHAHTQAREYYAAGNWAAALAAWPERANQERRLLKALLDGAEPATAAKMLPKKLKELWVNAYQSALFNMLLAERLAAGTLAVLQPGDVAYLHDRGACFVVEDAAAEQPRCDRLELSPAGPLFGTKTLAAVGEPGVREQALLAAEGIEPASFQLPGGLTQRGERRPYRMRLRDAALEWGVPTADACTVSFTLDAGCYATNVLAELTKNPDAVVDG